jgi:hypothetical protein
MLAVRGRTYESYDATTADPASIPVGGSIIIISSWEWDDLIDNGVNRLVINVVRKSLC